MDKEKNPKEVNYYPTFETNSMIEEFMLLGNVSVGEKILNNFPSVAVLRNHPPPKADQVRDVFYQ